MGRFYLFFMRLLKFFVSILCGGGYDVCICEAIMNRINTKHQTAERNYQTGDMIVCFTEQRAGLLRRPLNQILEAKVDAPVYILSGLFPQSPSRFNVLSLIPLWADLISIIAGAFLLQIRIMSLPRDWAQTTLLILSVIAEFWLIWAWNNLFS
jgi:hypothetical protein